MLCEGTDQNLKAFQMLYDNYANPKLKYVSDHYIEVFYFYAKSYDVIDDIFFLQKKSIAMIRCLSTISTGLLKIMRASCGLSIICKKQS